MDPVDFIIKLSEEKNIPLNHAILIFLWVMAYG